MTIFEAISLGIVQGLTEFLPVSSTGHLILVRKIFGQGAEGTLSFDAILQLSTTFAVIFYFRNDLYLFLGSIKKFIKTKEKDDNFKTLFFVVIATIPSVLLGIFLEEKMDSVFRNIKYVSLFLILGSFLMYFAERYHQRISSIQKLNLINSFKIGLFQSFALFPGFSRSGSTISGGLLSSLDRVEAVRFSFLLSIPILLGTGIKKVTEIDSVANKSELFIASVFAFVFGLLSIHFLIRFLKNHKMYPFIIYRVVLTVLILFII